jgi:hypothetical protein
MIAFIPLAIALTLPDESTQARAIYHRMESRILAAKTLFLRGRVRLEGDLRGDHPVRLRIATAENRLRYDRPDGEEKGVFVSEGPDLGRTGLTMFTRWGLERGVAHHLWRDNHWKAIRTPDLENFRILRREEIGPHKTVAVLYEQVFQLPDSPVTNRWRRATTLWIDEETFLPVKRVQHDGGRCIHWTTTETYEELRFDEEMPAHRFAPPKF